MLSKERFCKVAVIKFLNEKAGEFKNRSNEHTYWCKYVIEAITLIIANIEKEFANRKFTRDTFKQYALSETSIIKSQYNFDMSNYDTINKSQEDVAYWVISVYHLVFVNWDM